MSHGAHAALPVLLPVGETWGALSAVFRMSLVADLVAHIAVTGQPYQGLCVYTRSWLSVRSPLLLSSFPGCVQLWAPVPRCDPGAQLLACSPSLLQLPRHQGPRAGRKLQASAAACAVLFQTHAALRRVPTYA